MRKRILLIGDYTENDISALTSTDAPLSYFSDLFEVSYPPEKDGWWNNFRNWLYVDCVLVHRPWSDRHRKIMDAAKLHGVKLWVHHDDDLTCIPKSNPNFPITAAQDLFGCVEYSYQIADILSAQSKIMCDELMTDRGVYHLPVCLHDRLLEFEKPHIDSNRIAWRGSSTHISDLVNFQKPLQEIFDKYSDYEFHFFGLDPEAIGFKVKKLTVYPVTTMWNFYKTFTDLNPYVLLVLLEDNRFNRIKSHLSWLDGILGGAKVVAPDFPEFQHLGVFNYLNKENLMETFEQSIKKTNAEFALSYSEFSRYLISEQRNNYELIWRNI